ncbi:hypothetical protein [Tsuneonella troitsensis]|uniref:hypothetical protein n=1 Tax=Tsuneonella troitsensis TaxID=292222 RepID=UPI0007101787|nr:hypothetical protein [Tsuneonella troitsensis]
MNYIIEPIEMGYRARLFSTSLLKDYLDQRFGWVLDHFNRYGEPHVERYWLYDLEIAAEPFLCIKDSDPNVDWLEFRYHVSGSAQLWGMSPTVIVDRFTAFENAETWDASIPDDPALPLGHVCRDTLSLYARSEEDMQVSWEKVHSTAKLQLEFIRDFHDRVERHWLRRCEALLLAWT